jgi:hypothetical protein
MKMLGKTLGAILALGLLGALCIGGYYAVKGIGAVFARLDFQVAAVLAIASVVALAAALIVGISIRRASNSNRAVQFHAERVSAYQLFVEFWEDQVRERRGLKSQSTVRFTERLEKLNRKLVLHGHPSVVQAQTSLLALASIGGRPGRGLRSEFGEALMQIRKDLGSETYGLTAEHLLALTADSGDPEAPTAVRPRRDRQPRISLSPDA